MNIIALDVGNSRVGIAACNEGKLSAVSHLPGDASDDELKSALADAIAALAPVPAPRVVVSSVNPPGERRVCGAVMRQVDWPILRVGGEVDLPLDLAVDEPEAVGADRVLAAAAAFDGVGGPVVVASFGTALTINCVDADGRFLGGTISPGIGISAKLLHQSTAFLPEVTSAIPDGPWGKTTVSAIQAGLFYMAGGTIREVVERMATELGQWPHLVLTGGDAELIAQAYEFVDSVVPDLVLLGINIAFRKHVDRMGKR
ncbi:MAG: Type III pantothenate kinase [Phycisphaerae bacterium]|nr:Type III pantothenate kinase [Phycisphaerae bacterium]